MTKFKFLDFSRELDLLKYSDIEGLKTRIKNGKWLLRRYQSDVIKYTQKVALWEYELSTREKEKTKENISLVK